MAHVPGFGSCTWADYPQIGADASAYYITGSSFQCGANGGFVGAVLWELPRKDFEREAAKSLFRFWGFTTGEHHPVLTLTPAAEPSSETTEWFLSTDAGYVDGDRHSQQVHLWAIAHSGEPGIGDAARIVSTTVTLPYAYADPPAALQGGASAAYRTGDARVTQAYLAGGHLYAAFATAANWPNDESRTRSAVYWMDIIPHAGSTTTASARLSQANVFGFAGAYISYPSLVATSTDDILLFATASTPFTAPNLMYTTHLHGDAPDTMGQKQGAIFLQGVDQAGPITTTDGQWGGYAGAALNVTSDASGSATLWVAGAYVDPYAGSQWRTILGQLNATTG
jgi:hypothetical protein